jgi:6-phosphogluconate dehydrogenase
MRLTNQQITTIEQTLVLNGVVYDDIKLELLDHIATEIESIIDESQFSFEENLKKVFAKWKNELTPSSSFGLEITNQFLR